MSQYKVINRFKENNHDGHIYEAGDNYPAEGKKLVKARADFLTKQHKGYGVAFLEVVEQAQPPKKQTVKATAKKDELEDQGEKSDGA